MVIFQSEYPLICPICTCRAVEEVTLHQTQSNICTAILLRMKVNIIAITDFIICHNNLIIHHIASYVMTSVKMFLQFLVPLLLRRQTLPSLGFHS